MFDGQVKSNEYIRSKRILFFCRITKRFILPSGIHPDSIDSTDKSIQQSTTRETDVLLDLLVKRSDGVEIAHEHAKYLSKYMFALIHYVQERSAEEAGRAERLSKLANNCSLASFLTTYRFVPGNELMTKMLKKEADYQSKCHSTWMLLQTHEFVGVKNDHTLCFLRFIVFFSNRNLIHGEHIMIMYEKQ